MFHVYLLRSISNPDKIYTGFTTSIEHRLALHNTGCSIYTAKYKPWKLQCFFSFFEQDKAIAFEQYLKSGSGKAFAKKHFF